jgi:hypothetical protein
VAAQSAEGVQTCPTGYALIDLRPAYRVSKLRRCGGARDEDQAGIVGADAGKDTIGWKGFATALRPVMSSWWKPHLALTPRVDLVRRFSERRSHTRPSRTADSKP